MKPDYSNECFQSWITFNSIDIERKLVNETAFDGIVKIYSLKTNDIYLNSMFENKVFGNFYFKTPCGLLLRMLENKNSWPTTILVYFDFLNQNFIEVKKTTSSWDVWSVSCNDNQQYSIQISPDEQIKFQI